MGKATIFSGGEKGQYVVDLDYGKAQRDALVAALTKRIEDLNQKLIEAEQELAEEKEKTAEVVDEMNAAAQALADAIRLSEQKNPADWAAEQKAANEATTKVLQQRGKERVKQREVNRLKQEKSSIDKDRKALVAVTIEERKSVFCADYTVDAEGEVATLEVPGEPKEMLILPGGRGYNPAEDGALVAREVMTPAQVFFNAAILPGVQKFKPTYRIGEVYAKDDDENTVDLTLEDIRSSANFLPVNQKTTLQSVPVEYMECGSKVFEVGDRVVVVLRGFNWEDPLVIGFAEWPSPCLPWSCRFTYSYDKDGGGPSTDRLGVGYIYNTESTNFWNQTFQIDLEIDWRIAGGAWQRLNYLGMVGVFGAGVNGYMYHAGAPGAPPSAQVDPYVFILQEFTVQPWMTAVNPGVPTFNRVIELQPKGVKFDGEFASGINEFRIRTSDQKLLFHAAVLNDSIWLAGGRGEATKLIDYEGVGQELSLLDYEIDWRES